MIAIKIIISLILIIGLIFITLKVIQKYTKIGTNKLSNKNNQLSISSVIYVGDNTKVFVINRADVNYVLASNKNTLVLLDKYSSINNENINNI